MSQVRIRNRDCIMINLNNGDIFFLGKLRSYEPFPEYNFNDEYPVLEDILNKSSFEREGNAKFRESWIHKSSLLNYFLSCSIGCRLMIMSLDDFDHIISNVSDELGVGIIYKSNKNDHFSRRNANIIGKFDSDSLERSAVIEEIKALIKKNLTSTQDGQRMVFQWGSMPPESVLFDRIDRPKWTRRRDKSA